MNHKELAIEWYNRVVWIRDGHYLTARSLSGRHKILGGISVSLTAAVGTSVFASMAASDKIYMLVIAGALSVITTLVTSLQGFLSYNERTDKHRLAGARYSKVGRELEYLITSEVFEESKIESIKLKLDKLAEECLHIPDHINTQMEKDPPKPLELV